MSVGFLTTILAAYLIGAIPSGVIIARFFARRDLRAVGSGHTGTVNTYRAAGLGPAIFAFLADTGKAIIVVELARALTGNEWVIAIAGFVAVIGHCFPIYTRFHGGMGLATAGAVLFAINFPVLIILIAAWFALKYILKKSARASMVIAISLPVILALARADASQIAFGVAAGALIFWRHWRG